MLNIFKKRNKVLSKLVVYELNIESLLIYKKTNFLNKKGKKDHCDFMIASICIANNLILVSDDNDFQNID
jgi:predicted nucleic acid-binding protein